MRKIEKQMIEAISNKANWTKDNTAVVQTSLGACVYLFGNYIGMWRYDLNEFEIKRETVLMYPTSTTKSRLRALGVSVYTSKGTLYINNEWAGIA